jgi:flagellar basal-body rod modification protein FlgD
MSMNILGITGIADESAQVSKEAGAVYGEDDAMGQDAFLKLLTTQMAHQDPLDPMSNEQFVAQLAQFSSLEQLITMRTTMESVYMGVASMNNATMASLVGTHVVAVGNGINYDGSGSAELHYNASSDVSSGTLTVYDENGTAIYSRQVGNLSKGEGSLEWDGTDHDGQPVPEGNYTFSITGQDENGSPVEVSELVAGPVEEMDYTSGNPKPTVQGINIEIGSILRLTTGEES